MPTEPTRVLPEWKCPHHKQRESKLDWLIEELEHIAGWEHCGERMLLAGRDGAWVMYDDIQRLIDEVRNGSIPTKM